jgi:hypothetical protein
MRWIYHFATASPIRRAAVTTVESRPAARDALGNARIVEATESRPPRPNGDWIDYAARQFR